MAGTTSKRPNQSKPLNPKWAPPAGCGNLIREFRDDGVVTLSLPGFAGRILVFPGDITRLAIQMPKAVGVQVS